MGSQSFRFSGTRFRSNPHLLDEIAKAVRHVRASTPRSRLADLAEWKLAAFAAGLEARPDR